MRSEAQICTLTPNLLRGLSPEKKITAEVIGFLTSSLPLESITSMLPRASVTNDLVVLLFVKAANMPTRSILTVILGAAAIGLLPCDQDAW